MAEPPIRSRPYSTAACCEKCVFDRGEHALFCRAREEILTRPSFLWELLTAQPKEADEMVKNAAKRQASSGGTNQGSSWDALVY